MRLASPSIDALRACHTAQRPATPMASAVSAGIAEYDVAATDWSDTSQRDALMDEWSRILLDGAGVLVLRGAYADDLASVDAATAVFNAIIAEEKQAGRSEADHFAAAGNNDRVWNSLQKLALRAPEVFVRYHGNAAIDAVCEAWLGPYYQMTAQVNLVRPGGQAQQAHRDYHLGFQSAEDCARYPQHVHDLSAALTLQGAIAHVDMPIESGPTKLLPGSQQYRAGYLAWRDAAHREYFEQHCVQVALNKGDALFFSPALFHAAGSNTSAAIERMANLVQISSAYGRAMENIDRSALCKAIYPQIHRVQGQRRHAAIAACAEGYAFPGNLDRNPPEGGLAPTTQAQFFHQALAQGWSLDAFSDCLDALAQRQRP